MLLLLILPLAINLRAEALQLHDNHGYVKDLHSHIPTSEANPMHHDGQQVLYTNDPGLQVPDAFRRSQKPYTTTEIPEVAWQKMKVPDLLKPNDDEAYYLRSSSCGREGSYVGTSLANIFIAECATRTAKPDILVHISGKPRIY